MKEKEKGVALIIAMWFLVILAIVSSSFAFMMRTELKIVYNYRDEVRAYYAAMAGIEKSIAELRNYTSSSQGAPGLTIVINEIMANPSTSETTTEFIELYNTTGSPIDVQDWTIDDGGTAETIATTPTTILANGYGVIIDNDSTLSISPPAVELEGPDTTICTGGLLNTGEVLTLRDNTGAMVDQVDYSDFDDRKNWSGDGPNDGPSLECINPLSDNSDGSNWAASTPASALGTPGAVNSRHVSLTAIDSLTAGWASGYSGTLNSGIGYDTTYAYTVGDGTSTTTGFVNTPADGHFARGIVDEARKLNLNTENSYIADDDFTNEFVWMLKDLWLGLGDQGAVNIVDYRDSDDTQTERDTALGQESSAACRNANLEYEEELMLIRNCSESAGTQTTFGKTTFYGDDGRDSATEVDNHLLDSGEDDDSDGVLDGGLEDYITVHSYSIYATTDTGKERYPINVNTASKQVLKAVINPVEGIDNADAETAATAIINYRDGADNVEGTGDDNPFNGSASGTARDEFNACIDAAGLVGVNAAQNIKNSATACKPNTSGNPGTIFHTTEMIFHSPGCYAIVSLGYVERGGVRVAEKTIKAVYDKTTNTVKYWKLRFDAK